MPDYNAIAADNLNGLMREIAEYTRMAEEIAATLDGLKDTLARSREFDTVVNAFTFYNCNVETGRYPAFYVKGV